MRKLDRIPWKSGFTFTVHGRCFGVRTTAPALVKVLRERLPPHAKISRRRWVDSLYSVVGGDAAAATPRGVRRFHLLYANVLRYSRTMDLAELFDAFESALELDLAASARGRVFVHAGVVGWRGHAILIPGRTGSGKTSLVVSFLGAGARYYSDEFAVLDARGRVHPYARPLRIRGAGDRPERRRERRPGRVPLPVGLILSTRYKAGARWRPRRLSSGEAMMELLAHAVPARLRPRESVAAIANAVRGARALKGVRGEAEPLAILLLRQLHDSRV
jgi:hypothetical protein